jgi:hypothetical protein
MVCKIYVCRAKTVVAMYVYYAKSVVARYLQEELLVYNFDISFLMDPGWDFVKKSPKM